MGQRMAKKQIDDGLKFYSAENHEAAIRKWKNAFYKVHSNKEKFRILGYLAVASRDWGKYRDFLVYAVQQIEYANYEEDSHLRAEAYLNLAKANECLSEYHKIVSYCRHCIQNTVKDERVHGHAYATMANAYCGFSLFSKALEFFDCAMRVAKNSNDTILELQVFTGLGRLFANLKDFERSLHYHTRAAELAKSFNICDLNSKYQRMTSLQLATPLRMMGRFQEALDMCEDAMKVATDHADRPTQALCLCVYGDIYRRQNECEKAIVRYEACLVIMTDLGDRHGQAMCLLGLAKTLCLMKQSAKVCECKALELVHKSLEIAQAMGNKLLQLRCHWLQEELYRSLGDAEQMREQMKISSRLLDDMELFCSVCNKSIGEDAEKLETLPCAHIFHDRCVMEILYGRGMRICPTCQRVVYYNPNTNPVFCSTPPPESNMTPTLPSVCEEWPDDSNFPPQMEESKV